MKKTIKAPKIKKDENSLSSWNDIISEIGDRRNETVKRFMNKLRDLDKEGEQLSDSIITMSDILSQLNNLTSIYSLHGDESDDALDKRIQRIDFLRKTLNKMIK